MCVVRESKKWVIGKNFFALDSIHLMFESILGDIPVIPFKPFHFRKIYHVVQLCLYMTIIYKE